MANIAWTCISVQETVLGTVYIPSHDIPINNPVIQVSAAQFIHAETWVQRCKIASLRLHSQMNSHPGLSASKTYALND